MSQCPVPAVPAPSVIFPGKPWADEDVAEFRREWDKLAGTYVPYLTVTGPGYTRTNGRPG